jgi:hypothetical protein
MGTHYLQRCPSEKGTWMISLKWGFK